MGSCYRSSGHQGSYGISVDTENRIRPRRLIPERTPLRRRTKASRRPTRRVISAPALNCSKYIGIHTAPFEVVMCPALLAEVDEVLTGRERLRRWIELRLAEQFVDTVRTLVDLVADPVEVVVTTRDRDDDHLVVAPQESTSRTSRRRPRMDRQWVGVRRRGRPALSPTPAADHVRSCMHQGFGATDPAA